MASLSKGFGSALSFGSSFVQKAASFTKDNAVKIGSAAAHAGGEISKKAQDGSLAGQGSAVLGSAFGTFSDGLELSCCGILKISRFLERILMEHIDMKHSLDSKLQI